MAKKATKKAIEKDNRVSYEIPMTVKDDDLKKPTLFLHQQLMSGTFQHEGNEFWFEMNTGVGNPLVSMELRDSKGNVISRSTFNLGDFFKAWLQNRVEKFLLQS